MNELDNALLEFYEAENSAEWMHAHERVMGLLTGICVPDPEWALVSALSQLPEYAKEIRKIVGVHMIASTEARNAYYSIVVNHRHDFSSGGIVYDYCNPYRVGLYAELVRDQYIEREALRIAEMVAQSGKDPEKLRAAQELLDCLVQEVQAARGPSSALLNSAPLKWAASFEKKGGSDE